MIRRLLAIVLIALVAGCGGKVDADTRDLLRADMASVASAASASDYGRTESALRKLLDDTEAAYRAGKISSSRRSEIVTAAAKVQADLEAATAPVVTPSPAPRPDPNGDNGQGHGPGNGKGKGKGKG